MKCKRIFLLLLLMMLVACGSKTLHYSHLGYDVKDVDYSEITFRIYHSAGENHMWDLLGTLKLDKKPEEGHFVDIILESAMEKIKISLVERYEEKENGSIVQDGEVLQDFNYDIKGFNGNTLGFVRKEIHIDSSEQILLLYPITNGIKLTVFEKLSLDQAYDVEEKNIDNILVTATIEK